MYFLSIVRNKIQGYYNGVDENDIGAPPIRNNFGTVVLAICLTILKLYLNFPRAKFTLDFVTNIQAFRCNKSSENFALAKYTYHYFKSFKINCSVSYL